jgi:hypothetical protein
MALLKFVGLRDDINRIITGDINLPITKAILNKELVEVHAIVTGNDDLLQISNDLNDPLNIRFKMDSTEIKMPRYIDIDECEKLTKSPRSIFLGDLNLKKDSADLHYTVTEEAEKVVTGKYEKNILKNEKGTSSWISMFTQNEIDNQVRFHLPKSNSIVLNDSHLFNKSDGNPGILNLKELFKVIMPEKSNEEFQITIITASCNWIPSIARDRMNLLLNFLKSVFDYPIFIELVIWGKSKTDNHKRILVSNYYTVVSDYGFDVFNSAGMSSGTNDILVRRIFHDVNQPGESPYHQSNFRLNLMRNTYFAAKEFCRNFNPVTGSIYLNTGDYEMQNRLFNV